MGENKNEQNLLERASNGVDEGKKLAKNVFKGFINYISYAVVVIATVFLSLATAGFRNGITPDLIATMVIMIVINITSMCIFIPQGEDNEKKKSATYQTNLQVWGQKIAFIEQLKLLIKFREYCKKRTDDLREEIRENYIKSAGIEVEFYNKHLKELSLKELKLLRKKIDDKKRCEKITDEDLKTFTLTFKDYRALKKARGRINVSPISYSKILAGSVKGNTNYALQEHAMSYKARSIGFKGLTIILFTMTMACTVIIPNGASGFQVVLDIITRLLGVTVSTVMGYYTGIKSIRLANSDNKEKILFINEFIESEKVDIDKE